jgi:hypothetical protein
MTARLFAPVLAAAALVAGSAGSAGAAGSADAAADRPSAEACALVRGAVGQQGPAAATADQKASGRKLLGFAASALSNAAPQMFAGGRNDALKAAASQAAADAIRRAASEPPAAAPARGAYNSGPDAQALANFGATMGKLGPQGARAQAQIAAIQNTARATNGDTRAVQEEILRQSGC